MIEVLNLKKRFGNIRAVNGISFNVEKEEIFGLLGTNGAGKTTTIKLILGVLESDKGDIKVLNLNPLEEKIRVKKRIGYVAEEPLIYNPLNALELFNFIASIRKLDGYRVTEMMNYYAEVFELLDFLKEPIEELSHGNRQKIQIIAALLHEPDLLILDEPFSSLDPKSVRVFKEILKIHIKNGGGVLFSTHILKVAENICDRIAIIDRGKMMGLGTLKELRQKAALKSSSLEDVFLKLTENKSRAKKN